MAGESQIGDGNTLMQFKQSFDVTFDQLSHYRRRCALACLIEQGDRISLADLAEEVAIREHDKPITELSTEQVREVEITLYHWHIPKLAETDLIEYEHEHSQVRLTGDTGQIEHLIALTTDGV